MARGYPDFFGYSVFPTWGPANMQDHLVDTVNPFNIETVYELTQKGTIYGGWLRMYDSLAGGGSFIRCTIDGVLLSRRTPEQMLLYTLTYDESMPFFVTLHDIPGQNWIIQFSRGVNFGYQYKLELEHVGLGAIDIEGKLFYAYVQ